MTDGSRDEIERLIVQACVAMAPETDPFAVRMDGRLIHGSAGRLTIEASIRHLRGIRHICLQRSWHPYDGNKTRSDRRMCAAGNGGPDQEDLRTAIVQTLDHERRVKDRDDMMSAAGLNPLTNPPPWAFRAHRVFTDLLRHYGYRPQLLVRPGVATEYGLRVEALAGSMPKASIVELRMDRLHCVRATFTRTGDSGADASSTPEITFAQVALGCIVTLHGLRRTEDQVQDMRLRRMGDLHLHPALMASGITVHTAHANGQGLCLRIDDAHDPLSTPPEGVDPIWLETRGELAGRRRR